MIDPSRKLDAIRDVAIAQGRIVAIKSQHFRPKAAEMLDAPRQIGDARH